MRAVKQDRTRVKTLRRHNAPIILLAQVGNHVWSSADDGSTVIWSAKVSKMLQPTAEAANPITDKEVFIGNQKQASPKGSSPSPLVACWHSNVALTPLARPLWQLQT